MPGVAALATERLVGAWRLAAYHDVDEDGVTSEGPLGPDPEGLLLYEPGGFMAVSMMRTSSGPSGPSGGPSGPSDQYETFMGYAGRWRLDGDRVVHRAEVSAHAFQLGIDQVREVVLATTDEGDVLTLYGNRPAGDRPQRRMLRWRRATAAGPDATTGG